MRVTERMIFDSAQSQIASSRDRMQEAQQEVSTGQRVFQPGDDPAASGLIVSYTMAVQRHDVINKTASRAADEATVADGALQSVSTLLAQAHDLAVQLGNDTYSASDRAAGATEVKAISDQVVALMNTQVAGRYIFGGNVDRTPPFDASGNYNGDTAVRQVEVAPGLLQASSIRADQALKGVGGGVDVFASLSALTTALTNNDGAAIRSSVDDVVTASDQLSQAETQNGGILDAFQSAQNIGGIAKDTAQKLLSSEADADPFDATSRLALAQQSLQASLDVAARGFGISLMNFMPAPTG
jgi:flagellar hook-associated protein 3 FlgL